MQGWPTLVLESRSPACFRCFPAPAHLVYHSFESGVLEQGNIQKHSGLRLSRTRVGQPFSTGNRSMTKLCKSYCSVTSPNRLYFRPVFLNWCELVWSGSRTYASAPSKNQTFIFITLPNIRWCAFILKGAQVYMPPISQLETPPAIYFAWHHL